MSCFNWFCYDKIYLERMGCESTIHDHDRDFWVNMVGWGDLRDYAGVTSDAGMRSTHLASIVFRA